MSLIDGAPQKIFDSVRRWAWRVTPKVYVDVYWPIDYGCDPNAAYRPWLERNVGRQFVDWDWDLTLDVWDRDALRIHLRKKHQHMACMIALMWA
jgi:hypothetical protein